MSSSRAPWWASPWLSIRVQLALGAIFVAAAVPKILDPPAFAHRIYNYRLLPGVAVNAAALVLPWVEILAGLALVVGFWKRTAAGIAGVLLLVFVAALSINLARRNPVECGCFDVKSQGKPRGELLADMRLTIARDAGLLLLVLQALAVNRGPGRRPRY